VVRESIWIRVCASAKQFPRRLKFTSMPHTARTRLQWKETDTREGFYTMHVGRKRL
jgi:hypothetical protein